MMIQATPLTVDLVGTGAAPAAPLPAPGVPQLATPAGSVHSSAEMRRALDALAHRLDAGRTQLSFRVDQQLNQVVISIVDPESGVVLRQIPGEEVLRMAQNLQEWLGGLVDETA